MTAADLKLLRDGRGWTQQSFADVLNGALNRRYSSATISQWELGKRPVPQIVVTFLDELKLAEALGRDTVVTLPPPPAETGEPAPAGAPPRQDLPPGDPDGRPAAQPSLSPSGGMYAQVCTELWEMMGTGLGILGAATGNQKLVQDGQIIAADRVALGRAYGKLAETNETFRRMITGGVSSGVWLEVALVTGGTVSKLWSNHADGRGEHGTLTGGPRPAGEAGLAAVT